MTGNMPIVPYASKWVVTPNDAQPFSQADTQRRDAWLEEGVVLALRDVAQQVGLSWDAMGAEPKRECRLHLATY